MSAPANQPKDRGTSHSNSSHHNHPPQQSLLHLGGGGHSGGEEHGEGNWLVSYADMMTLLVGFFVILLSFSVMDAKKFDEAKKSITQEFGGTYQVPYSELKGAIEKELGQLGVGDQLLLKTSESGIEISFKGTVFFDTGSADLKDESVPVLKGLIQAIKSENERLQVTIEGHTDDVPVVGGKIFRNNWELSSIRACRVLETFLNAGLPKELLTAVGFADAHPLVPNRDAEGASVPENQAQNRRVIIRIVRSPQPVIETNPNPSTESKFDSASTVPESVTK